ncbi:MAG: HEAT repeat domain-containing protein [Planctomycetia bacterium]|nr:HEAT repeat domain-containing protein [Planctomycetia bacterium]
MSDNHCIKCLDKQRNSCRFGVGKILFLILFMLLWSGLGLLTLLFAGCATPFFATDNRFLLCLPGAERKSDEIDGVLRPWERAALIKEKGEKGPGAKPEEQDIIIEQLIAEFGRSTDPNMRRATVTALGKMGQVRPEDSVGQVLAKALYDENLGVRLSAAHALGIYDKPSSSQSRASSPARTFAVERLCARYQELPYSIEAGAKKENDDRKDLRLAILRNLELFRSDDSPVLLETLGAALEGEKLDDGALQTATMKTLKKVTGKEYGLDARKWHDYIAWTKGEQTAEPEELSLMQRLPVPDMPMFK